MVIVQIHKSNNWSSWCAVSAKPNYVFFFSFLALFFITRFSLRNNKSSWVFHGDRKIQNLWATERPIAHCFCQGQAEQHFNLLHSFSSLSYEHVVTDSFTMCMVINSFPVLMSHISYRFLHICYCQWLGLGIFLLLVFLYWSVFLSKK